MIAEALRNAFSRGHVMGEGGELTLLTGGDYTAAGERVSKETALKVAAVYGAVSIISSAVRAMPLEVKHDRGDDILRPARDSRLWGLLHDQANPEQHASELWEWITLALLLRGNGYAWIDRAPNGQVRALRPLNPGRVEVGRDLKTRRKVFAVSAADDREQVVFVGNTNDILHVRGFGDDPLLGVSVIYHMRETIGRTLSEDRHAAVTMKNQGRPSGILSVPGRLDDERATALAARWNSAHGGSRSGRTAVLEDGATWAPVTMTAADLELVKQRAISREDIAIAFQVPGDMLLAGSQANLHYSTDATRDVRLVKHAVMPWAKRIQDALEICELLPWGAGVKGRLVPRFNPDGLLRADIKTRYEAYQLALPGRNSQGWLTPDEVRALEDWEPKGGSFSEPPPPPDPPTAED